MNRTIIQYPILDGIKKYSFSETDTAIIDEYVNINASFIDIRSFYTIFEYNIELFNKMFSITYSDNVKCLEAEHDNEECLNAHFINIISAGRTLIESIERDTKKISGNDSFNKNVISSVFDNSFSYRIIYKLRHYSQHGHLPIKYEKGKCSIDINIILSEPDFNLGNIEKELESLSYKMHGNGNLAFKITLNQYIVNVMDVYLNFLSWIKEIEVEKREKVHSVINDINDPIIIYKSDENGKLHAFEKSNGLGDLIDGIRNEMIQYIAYLQTEIEDVWNNCFHNKTE